MSLKEFWSNVRMAARLMAPGAVADSPKQDRARIESVLRKAPIWLTPEAVDGFDALDFGFLTPAERQDLSESVLRFREVAGQVPQDQPGKDGQVEHALRYFLRILDLVRPDKYGDADALIIGKKIEQQLADQWPPSVDELRFDTGEDAHGGPALWIWVVLKDEAVEGDAFVANVRSVRRQLEYTVKRLRIERWPYVRFRTVSELEPRVKKSAK